MSNQNNGWVCLHRKLLDNPVVMKDAEHLAVWIYLLLHATHEEYPAFFKGQKITLLPGQLITGRKAIAAELGISESKVRRVLDLFENDQQIDQQMTNKNRLITLKNWHEYQDTDQQTDQQLTNNRPTTDQQLTTNNNINNIRNIERKENIKEKKENPFQLFRPEDSELQQALQDYASMRKAIKKPLTDRSMQIHINKLQTFPENQWIAIIEQSISHNWQSFYKLSDKPQQFNQPGFHKQTKAEELEDSYRMLAEWAEGD